MFRVVPDVVSNARPRLAPSDDRHRTKAPRPLQPMRLLHESVRRPYPKVAVVVGEVDNRQSHKLTHCQARVGRRTPRTHSPSISPGRISKDGAVQLHSGISKFRGCVPTLDIIYMRQRSDARGKRWQRKITSQPSRLRDGPDLTFGTAFAGFRSSARPRC